MGRRLQGTKIKTENLGQENQIKANFPKRAFKLSSSESLDSFSSLSFFFYFFLRGVRMISAKGEKGKIIVTVKRQE